MRLRKLSYATRNPRSVNGRTPARAFKDGLPNTTNRKETKPAESRNANCLDPGGKRSCQPDYPLCRLCTWRREGRSHDVSPQPRADAYQFKRLSSRNRAYPADAQEHHSLMAARRDGFR